MLGVAAPSRRSWPLIAGALVALSGVRAVEATSGEATPAAGGDERHDALILSVGVTSPSAPFVAGERVAYLEDGELLVWIDPAEPADRDTLEVDRAVTGPVATTDAIFIPGLFAVTELALADGAERAVYQLDPNSESGVMSLAASDDAVAVGAYNWLAVFDRGHATPRWSIPTGGTDVTEVAVTPRVVVAELSQRGSFQTGVLASESGEIHGSARGIMLDGVVTLDQSRVAIAATVTETDDHRIDGADAVTGQDGWVVQAADRFDTVALVGEAVVATDQAPSVRLVDPADGTVIAHDQLAGRARHRAVAHPTLGAVIVDDTGTVYAFDPATGEPTIEPFAIGNSAGSTAPGGLGPASEVHGFALAGDVLYVTLTGESWQSDVFGDGTGSQSALIGVDLARLAG